MKCRNLLVVIICALAAFMARAQTVTLTAANIKTLSGAAFSGKLCMVPADNNGHVIGFQYGNGGQGVTSRVCWQVTSGVLQSSVTVPDTYQTNPQNLCLYTQLIDPSQTGQAQIVRTYPCLQPASSGQNWCSIASDVTICNLDNYQPSTTPGYVEERNKLTAIWVVPAGSAKTAISVGPVLIVPYQATFTRARIIVKVTDTANALTIVICKNGVSAFTMTIPAASTGLQTATPNLTVSADDLLTLNITAGSATWDFTLQLETAI
jgi:hypothetical protein